MEQLTLAHQDLLEPLFKEMKLNISEYSFANAYLFRHIHLYELIFSKQIYLRGKTRDGFTYLMPTMPVEKFIWEDLLTHLKGCDFLFPIPQSWEYAFKPDLFESSYLEADSDYIYSVQKLSTLPGRHLSSRRNLVKQFHELYPSHYVLPLAPERFRDVEFILNKWVAEIHEEAKLADWRACQEALSYFEKFQLSGIIAYAEKEPVGFIIGEAFNPDYYVFHFSKGLIQYKGIYQYLYQEFAKLLENQYKFINLEQDLGSLELKQSKRSYVPDFMNHKLRLKLRHHS